MSKIIYHIHHKIPKHMGGTNDPTNLIKLTIEEHAEAHRLLFEQHGNKFDYIAYMALSKQIGFEEANYMKLLGPKKWTAEGKQQLKDAAKKRSGKNNPFYGKKHSDETKAKQKKNCRNEWIKGIDPAKLPYTKLYEIVYTNGDIKQFVGLKAIATEFNVSIENVHATMKRICAGKIPGRGTFKGLIIREIS